MVLLPAGLVFGKAILNAVQKRGQQSAKRVVRTSALMTGRGDNNCVFRDRRKEECDLRRRDIHYNPYTKEEIRNRMGGTSVRMLHKQAERDASALTEALENEDWIPVYRFSGIRFGVLLARAKLVQTIASVLYLPYSAFGLLTGTADHQTFIASAVIAVTAPLLLFVFSRYLNRLVGVISMNESNEFVRIGYLSFWGGRRNKYLEVADVLPLSESCTGKDNVVKLQWYSSGQNFLFLSTKNCEIVDEKRAEILFGDMQMFDCYKKL